MSKYFNKPVVGIDVSAEFSVVAILSPTGEIYRKPFKIKHTRDGFDYLSNQTKKAEEEFNMKTAIFMESTGVYHLTLFHFLNDKFDTFIFNPIVTNCNKNGDIRKVKNDKKDALTIAKIGKFQNVKYSSNLDIEIYTLKSLCRDYYKLIDSKSTYKRKLSTDLKIIFPKYNTVFSDITGKTSLIILKNYPSPESVLSADKDEIVKIIYSNARIGISRSEKLYEKLITAAKESLYIGIHSPSFSTKIKCSIAIIESFAIQIKSLLNEIESLLESSNLPNSYVKNMDFLESIPGIGRLTALTVMAEIGDIKNFTKSKKLVAFFGIDSSVNQSGKFIGDRNSMSKRGTSFGRRALYAAAISSIRTNTNGEPVNIVLHKYYHEKLNGKPKKVKLGAIMHKLINYIFAVLRNQKKYEIRDPEIHARMYLKNHSTEAA